MMTDAREDIMDATFRALCEHGCADLTVQEIADETETGKSLIYYHFDDKEDLLRSFLEHLADQIRAGQDEHADRPADERLRELLEMMLGTDDEHWQFQQALHELRVKGQSDPVFAEKFQEIDAMIVEDLAGILDELGADAPRERADLLFCTIEGAMFRKTVAQDRDGLDQLRAAIMADLEDRLSL